MTAASAITRITPVTTPASHVISKRIRGRLRLDDLTLSTDLANRSVMPSTTHIIATRMLRQLLCAMGRSSMVTPRGRTLCAAGHAERSDEPIIAGRPWVSGMGVRAMDRRIMVPHDGAMESKHALWWALTIARTANCLTGMHLRGIDPQMGGCYGGLQPTLMPCLWERRRW